jgi:hypothetical protein
MISFHDFVLCGYASGLATILPIRQPKKGASRIEWRILCSQRADTGAM